jgi:hypothetical protein
MRAKLVENINFERTKNPRASLDVGGISLGKARFDKKKESEEEWINWLKNLLEGKKISGTFKHMYTLTPDGMDFDGKDEWLNTSINIKTIDEIKDPWDANHVPVLDTEDRFWIIPINDKKIFIEGKIQENQNFYRGVKEPMDLGLGKWKDWEQESFAEQEKGVKVSLKEFIENGGVLKPGREIWRMDDTNHWPIGEYLRYDDNQNVHLGKTNNYKSIPIDEEIFGVRVKTKVLYQ